jgi:H/ACA ribonucleoprotein complex subunit 1
MHDCEADLVCRWTLDGKVPYFNAGIYLENKRKIGKVDEILGKVAEIFFTVKMDPGVLSKTFQPNDLLYVGTDKLLPLTRFTNPGAPGGGGRSVGRGSRGSGRVSIGGRVPSRGGRVPSRGGGRVSSSGGSRSPGRFSGRGISRVFSPGRGRGRGRQ